MQIVPCCYGAGSLPPPRPPLSLAEAATLSPGERITYMDADPERWIDGTVSAVAWPRVEVLWDDGQVGMLAYGCPAHPAPVIRAKGGA